MSPWEADMPDRCSLPICLRWSKSSVPSWHHVHSPAPRPSAAGRHSFSACNGTRQKRKRHTDNAHSDPQEELYPAVHRWHKPPFIPPAQQRPQSTCHPTALLWRSVQGRNQFLQTLIASHSSRASTARMRLSDRAAASSCQSHLGLISPAGQDPSTMFRYLRQQVADRHCCCC